MASAFVPPPPPEDDFLDPILLSSQQKDSSYGGSLGYSEHAAGLQKTYSFGGEGFLDLTDQDVSSGGYAAAGRSGRRETLQRVPETPALTRAYRRTPRTEDCRLDFSFDTPSVSSGRGHIGLRPVSEIPARYRSVFSGFTHFNLVQSKVFDDVMYTDLPLVASAPTGSGKTVIFELAIIRLMMQMGEQVSSAKMVYVAPMKALCSERYEDWQAKFGPLGLRCCELTGDSQLDDYFELQNAQIVMTTPEKWDSMTRKWRDHKSLVQLVRLFLIDEVHQLNDNARGPTMEAIVSRMKTVRASLSWEEGGRGPAQPEPGSEVLRFIAISATIPNITDVASWLGSEELPALEYSIDESHRPVQLRRVVLSYPNASSEFKFDLSLNYRLSSVIHCYSDQKPTLVFCATRKGTQQAASTLVKDARFVMNSEHKQRLQRATGSLRDSKLRELVVYGVGYHHAGMEIADRKVMERMFTTGDLPVLFSTSTLAMGVNLPAHLVVIKSTLHYVGGMFQEYSESQILQMIGRAGRPQFDTTATAVIMTRHSTKVKYEALLGGTQLIESSLHRNLIEHLNAEIVLHTITDISIALEWLKSTFLFIRIKQNPRHYGIPEDQVKMEEKLQELCLKDLNLLEANSLIKMEDGFVLNPTDTGRLMARYCVAFESMKRFLTLKGDEGLAELVGMVAQCKEFEDVHLRVNEKRVLNTLNKDKNRLTIRFPMSGKIKSTDMKVNCLIQATLGCLPIQEFALNQDSQKIFRAASRLVRCLMELQLLGDNFNLQLSATLMHKCIQARLWDTSKHVAKQLEKIGVTLSTTLVNAGLTTFEKLQETNPRELELIMNRHPPFGNQIRDAVAKLPRYAISLEQSSSLSAQQAELTVLVQLVNHTLLKEAGSTAGPTHTCLLLIGDADNHVLIKQKISDSQLLTSGKFSRRLTVKRASSSPELRVRFISLEYVGIDVQEVYSPRYSGAPALTGHTTQAAKEGARRGSYKPCAHRCINKTVCGHACCRNGILVKETGNDELREFQSPFPAPPTRRSNPRPSPTPTPTRVPAAARGRAPPPRKRGQGAMGSFLSELHTRTSYIPETPALKRLKPSLSASYPGPSSHGSEHSPSLSERFSYAPSAKRMSPLTKRGPMRNKLNASYAVNSSTSSFSSGSSEEVTKSSLPAPPISCHDDCDDFDFQDDDVFEFQSDPDSDADLPAFTMDTSYGQASTAIRSAQSNSEKQYQNSTSRFSRPKNPSHKIGPPNRMTARQEIDRAQKPGSMPPPAAATGQRRPFGNSFSNTLDPLPDYHTYHSTASGLPTSSTPKKPSYRPSYGAPLPRTSSTPAGSQQVPLSKKLLWHMESSAQTRPPVARPEPGVNSVSASTTAKNFIKEPPFTFIPQLAETTRPHPAATPIKQPPTLATGGSSFHYPPSQGTSAACSFFTAGPVSRDDDGDLFDSVFAGIF